MDLVKYLREVGEKTGVNFRSGHGRERMRKSAALLILVFPVLLFPPPLSAQENVLLANANDILVTEGWSGFLEFSFLASLVGKLCIATVLSAIIGFHPRVYSQIKSPSQFQSPKSFVLYAVVGAVVGILVQQYGPIMGLVMFGLGGLMRFRSTMDSPMRTGTAILATLIGLCCGMGAPHVATVTTAFVFVLLFFLERDIIYQIVIMSDDPELLAETAELYRRVLQKFECEILGEQRNVLKQEIQFVVRLPKHDARAMLGAEFDALPERLRGAVDWKRS